jgi:hypothetical protein
MYTARRLRTANPLSEGLGATLMADAFLKKSVTHASTVLADHPERRDGPRYGLNADTEVEEPRTQAKVFGRTTDLGLGGCYIDAMTTFPAGTEVCLRIKRGGLTFEADSKIIYGKQGMGMGVVFLGMGQEEKAVLDQWILELSGALDKPAKREPALPNPVSEGTERVVLQQLITLLMRKGVLSQAETEAFRREMDRKSRNT